MWKLGFVNSPSLPLKWAQKSRREAKFSLINPENRGRSDGVYWVWLRGLLWGGWGEGVPRGLWRGCHGRQFTFGVVSQGFLAQSLQRFGGNLQKNTFYLAKKVLGTIANRRLLVNPYGPEIQTAFCDFPRGKWPEFGKMRNLRIPSRPLCSQFFFC